MKKRIISLALLLGLVLTLLPNGMTAAAANDANVALEILTPAQYDTVNGYTEGLMAVQKDGQWMYIDEVGNVVIGADKLPKMLTRTVELYDNYSGTTYNEELTFLLADCNGFRNGAAKLRYIEYNAEYDDGEYYENILLDSRYLWEYICFYVFIDMTGSIILEGYNSWGSYGNYSEDIVIAYNQSASISGDGIKAYNKDGVKIYDSNAVGDSTAYGGFFNNGLLTYETFSYDIIDDEFFSYTDAGYVDKNFKKVLSGFQEVRQFHNGIAPAKKDDAWGFINTSGQYVVQPQYDDFWVRDMDYSYAVFHDGLAAVEKDGKWGYIDTTGKLVVPFQFDYEEEEYYNEDTYEWIYNRLSAPGFFYNGMAYLLQNGKYGCIDKQGNLAVPYIYDDFNYYQHGAALVGTNGTYKLIDTAGNAISDETWQFETTGLDAYESDTILYKQNGKWGLAQIVSTKASSWARADVTRANELGLIPSQLNYNYTNNITRAEFCALAVPLYEKLNGEITTLATFPDSNDINVRKIGGLGVVVGTSDGSFNPYGEITRQEAALILKRLADALGKPLPAAAPTFGDYMNSWAKDAVGAVEAGGIMQGIGSGNFGALQPYTREQSILTLLRMWDWMAE